MPTSVRRCVRVPVPVGRRCGHPSQGWSGSSSGDSGRHGAVGQSVAAAMAPAARPARGAARGGAEQGAAGGQQRRCRRCRRAPPAWAPADRGDGEGGAAGRAAVAAGRGRRCSVPRVKPAVKSSALSPPPAAAVVDRTFWSRSGPVTRKSASPDFGLQVVAVSTTVPPTGVVAGDTRCRPARRRGAGACRDPRRAPPIRELSVPSYASSLTFRPLTAWDVVRVANSVTSTGVTNTRRVGPPIRGK